MPTWDREVEGARAQLCLSDWFGALLCCLPGPLVAFAQMCCDLRTLVTERVSAITKLPARGWSCVCQTHCRPRSLYDIVGTEGVGADLSHINTSAKARPAGCSA